MLGLVALSRVRQTVLCRCIEYPCMHQPWWSPKSFQLQVGRSLQTGERQGAVRCETRVCEHMSQHTLCAVILIHEMTAQACTQCSRMHISKLFEALTALRVQESQCQFDNVSQCNCLTPCRLRQQETNKRRCTPARTPFLSLLSPRVLHQPSQVNALILTGNRLSKTKVQSSTA